MALFINAMKFHGTLDGQHASMAYLMEIEDIHDGQFSMIFHGNSIKFHDIPSLFHGLPWKLLICMENLGTGSHEISGIFYLRIFQELFI